MFYIILDVYRVGRLLKIYGMDKNMAAKKKVAKKKAPKKAAKKTAKKKK